MFLNCCCQRWAHSPEAGSAQAFRGICSRREGGEPALLAQLAGSLETPPSPGGVWEPPARPWLMSSLDLRVPSAGLLDGVTAAEWAGCAGLGTLQPRFLGVAVGQYSQASLPSSVFKPLLEVCMAENKRKVAIWNLHFWIFESFLYCVCNGSCTTGFLRLDNTL